MLPFIFRNLRPIGANLWRRRQTFFKVSTKWQYYKLAVSGYPNHTLLDIHLTPTSFPAHYPPELERLIREYIKKDFAFKAKSYLFLETYMNPIYGELEVLGTPKFTTVTVEPGTRERLVQYLQACNPGTYGHYAGWFLGKVEYFVGNLFSANIDQLFIAMAPFVNQPQSEIAERLMNRAETMYWKTRKDLVDWLAGELLSERSRGWGSQIASAYLGKINTGLPPERVFTQEQLQDGLQQVTETMEKFFDELDPQVMAAWAEDIARRFIESRSTDRIV